MAGDTCDVCGKDDFRVNVCSSVLGAMSFAFCPICLLMVAEPRYWVNAAVEVAEGVEHINPEVILTYYDHTTDTYQDVRHGLQKIKFKDGREFTTRRQAVKILLKRQREYDYDLIEYLKKKLEFVQGVVDSLMDRSDPGGALPVFPEFEEWREKKEKQKKKFTLDLSSKDVQIMKEQDRDDQIDPN